MFSANYHLSLWASSPNRHQSTFVDHARTSFVNDRRFSYVTNLFRLFPTYVSNWFGFLLDIANGCGFLLDIANGCGLLLDIANGWHYFMSSVVNGLWIYWFRERRFSPKVGIDAEIFLHARLVWCRMYL
jgi:hypothetical protein